jgi:uncharacterized protein with HEPN domain
MIKNKDYTDYMDDIAGYAEKAIRFLNEVSFDDFAKNEEKTLATVRSLEVIGEAAKHIPKSIRKQHPDIPWEDMAGMRDKLIHDYFGVNLEVVWRTVKEDLPPLLKAIRNVTSPVKNEVKITGAE